jgi:hypothetical protein
MTKMKNDKFSGRCPPIDPKAVASLCYPQDTIHCIPVHIKSNMWLDIVEFTGSIRGKEMTVDS